ncbi:MAG: endonuclease/exonuclease/phosphatase family protein [Bacteroidales bacterium]
MMRGYNKCLKLLWVFLLFLVSEITFGQELMKVMTYNIGYDNSSTGNWAWKNRSPILVDQIRYYKPDIIGVQEALSNQMDDLREMLFDYESFGVGRDDGGSKGEFAAIFFRMDRFRLQGKGTFWLSSTPDKPGSKSWNTSLPRIVTYVELEDLKSKEEFFVFNTHWDNVSEEARINSAKLLLKKIQKIAGNKKLLILGDFNAVLNSAEMKELIQNKDALLKDSRQASQEIAWGPDYTFIGKNFTPEKGNVIDHILVNIGIEVLKYAVLSDNFYGVYPSDHLPVFVEIKL